MRIKVFLALALLFATQPVLAQTQSGSGNQEAPASNSGANSKRYLLWKAQVNHQRTSAAQYRQNMARLEELQREHQALAKPHYAKYQKASAEAQEAYAKATAGAAAQQEAVRVVAVQTLAEAMSVSKQKYEAESAPIRKHFEAERARFNAELAVVRDQAEAEYKATLLQIEAEYKQVVSQSVAFDDFAVFEATDKRTAAIQRARETRDEAVQPQTAIYDQLRKVTEEYRKQIEPIERAIQEVQEFAHPVYHQAISQSNLDFALATEPAQAVMKAAVSKARAEYDQVSEPLDQEFQKKINEASRISNTKNKELELAYQATRKSIEDRFKTEGEKDE